MQKVLLASTALVLTTGWAMADVTNAGDGVGASISLSGEAWMGIIGDDFDERARFIDTDGDGEPDDFVLGGRDAGARFFTDIDLKFTMTGMTDGGLEFGAEVDLDEADHDRGTFSGERQGGETMWLRGAFGNLTMGDTDGAFDWAMQESIIGGSLGDINEHAGYSGNSGLDGLFYDGQIARYDYSFGDFGVAVSAEIDDFDEGDPVLAIGGKYTFAGAGFDATIGAGIQSVGDIGDRSLGFFDLDDVGATIYGISGNVNFGAIQVIADYSRIEYEGLDDLGVDDGSHWGVALGYETGPWLFAVNYGHFEDFIEVDFTDDQNIFVFGDAEGYALTANYDLGGGASLQGAISHNNRSNDLLGIDDSFVRYSFGVAMKF